MMTVQSAIHAVHFLHLSKGMSIASEPHPQELALLRGFHQAKNTLQVDY